MTGTRTVRWAGDHLDVVDQTALPVLRRTALRTVDEVIDAIARLVVRGAPAIGVAGAFGVVLSATETATATATTAETATATARLDQAAVRRDAARIVAARPTAVNLAYCVERVLLALDDGRDAVLGAALALLEHDVWANETLARRGAALLRELVGQRPMTLHTHCNAGALACVDWGTALGIVRALHEDAMVAEVFVDETRPLLQGARITAVELESLGVPYRVLVDGAGPGLVLGGTVDAVVVGADRVTANLDVVNKVGTVGLALAASRAGVPFVVAAPESTLDPDTATGADVPIEERDGAEVLSFAGTRTTPDGARARNPAFDVTPADLVTAVVTEHRVLRPGVDTVTHRIGDVTP